MFSSEEKIKNSCINCPHYHGEKEVPYDCETCILNEIEDQHNYLASSTYAKENIDNEKTIILINGSGGCGKSTFVKFCKFLNNKVIELSTVDYVKEVAIILGWDGTKSEKNRAFLHDLKMALENWKDIPNLKVSQAIEKDKENQIFFINVREIEGIKKLQQYYKVRGYKCYTLLVKNSHVDLITSNEADANVNNFNYDYVIDNSGTIGELMDKAQNLLNDIQKEK